VDIFNEKLSEMYSPNSFIAIIK